MLPPMIAQSDIFHASGLTTVHLHQPCRETSDNPAQLEHPQLGLPCRTPSPLPPLFPGLPTQPSHRQGYPTRAPHRQVPNNLSRPACYPPHGYLVLTFPLPYSPHLFSRLPLPPLCLTRPIFCPTSLVNDPQLPLLLSLLTVTTTVTSRHQNLLLSLLTVTTTVTSRHQHLFLIPDFYYPCTNRVVPLPTVGNHASPCLMTFLI